MSRRVSTKNERRETLGINFTAKSYIWQTRGCCLMFNDLSCCDDFRYFPGGIRDFKRKVLLRQLLIKTPGHKFWILSPKVDSMLPNWILRLRRLCLVWAWWWGEMLPSLEGCGFHRNEKHCKKIRGAGSWCVVAFGLLDQLISMRRYGKDGGGPWLWLQDRGRNCLR